MVCSLRGDFFYRIGPSGGRRCARHYMGSVSLGTGSNRTDIGGRSSGPWAALAEVGSGIGNHGGSFGIKCAATRRGPDCGRALRAPVLADTTWVCGEVRMVDGADRVGR
jgi:hypothetical protein